MESVAWGFIGTLVGAIVGASASIVTTIITGRNSRKLQEDAEELERNERARAFQRTNLLELQDALSIGMRLVGRVHTEDVVSFRSGEDRDGRPYLSDELNQELMISNRKLSILTERIADDSLRENIKNLREKMSNVAMSRDENESLEALNQAAISFETTMKQLGVILRGSY